MVPSCPNRGYELVGATLEASEQGLLDTSAAVRASHRNDLSLRTFRHRGEERLHPRSVGKGSTCDEFC